VAVIGPSGSGKTTLFHIIAGLLSPSQGEVLVHGMSLDMFQGKDRDRWRASTIGYVFQSFNLLPAFSALENVCLALDLVATMPRAARRARASALLRELGLGPRLHHRPGAFEHGRTATRGGGQSPGQCTSRAVADEPTANVDPETREVVLARLLAAARNRGEGAHGGHARSQSAHQVRPCRTFGQARPGTHDTMLALRVALRNLGFRPVLTAVTLALLGLAVAQGTVVVLLARAFEAAWCGPVVPSISSSRQRESNPTPHEHRVVTRCACRQPAPGVFRATATRRCSPVSTLKMTKGNPPSKVR